MDEFLVWVAGFYEGEGYAGLVGPRADRKYVVMSIAQNHEGILQLIQQQFGGGMIANSPTSWRLCWNGKKARAFAGKIRPFMRHPKKIEQLERALRLSRT